MAIGSGLSGQLGMVKETTFGTAVAVTRFFEFNSESVDLQKTTVQGMGLRAGGQVARAIRRVLTATQVSGDFEIDLPAKGLGLLLSAATGTAPTGTANAGGTGKTFDFTLGDLFGSSYTFQIGVPQFNGTVTPKTIAGCKISSFELSVDNVGMAKGKFSIDGKSMTTSGTGAAALQTASYTTANNLFHFAQGSITVNGTTAGDIRDFSISVDNALKTDRFNLGSLTKSEQVISGFRKITGKMTVEFNSTTYLDAYVADSNVAVVLTLAGATIAGSDKESIVITLPQIKLDGDTPNVSGPDVIMQNISFEALADDSTGQPMTIRYITSDSAL